MRLCGYSQADQERFVRAQLLKGLRNRQLAQTARTYGHEINLIVQSATRDEAYEAESSRDVIPASRESGVYAVQQRRWQRPTQDFRKRNREDVSDGNQQSKRYRGYEKHTLDRRSRCSRCNRPAHQNGRVCPALHKRCNVCQEVGHFAATCRRKRIHAIQHKETQPSTPAWSGDEEDNKQEVNTLSLQDVLIDCCLGSSAPIQFMIDSGADVNVIGECDWKRLSQDYSSGRAAIKPIELANDKSLLGYGSGHPMSIVNVFQAKIAVLKSTKPTVDAKFYVVKGGRRSLLGRETASDLKLLQVGRAVNNCESVDEHETFPKMPGVQVTFNLDKTVAPTRNAYYNVPSAFRDGARRRLEEMEANGIIEKVNRAPEWISGMSAVPKGKDDFRLVVNMRGPNKAIKQEYYRLPLLEEMKVKLFGARYFSKLDLRNAYYHLELAEESRDLTTFLAENGMYRFTRLMFGVNCAPEVFQREMVRILNGVKNVIVYIDDVLIFASTLEELRITVAEVLTILKTNNLTVNESKCEFDKARIQFLGHEIDEHGFHVEQSKIDSILRFRPPTTASELRSFLGLASFISSHIQGFADISRPLWTLTSKGSWSWGPQQQKSFEEIKERIAQCTVSLGFFSEHDKTVLYTDASPVALGAVLIQEGDGQCARIISFASKALTETERKYPQNQREALSAVWAVEHFAFYLLGRRFVLRTDAQGVAFILNRTREDSKRALTRADGWALRLSPYDYEIEYVRGCDNIADPSSRLYNGNDNPFDEETSPWEVAMLEVNAVGFLTENEIRDSTSRDTMLQQVILSLNTGEWPDSLSRFRSLEQNLSVKNGIIVKTGCAVIPADLRKRTLEVAHEGHPSASKMKTILRQRVWWPGMPSEAEAWVKTCPTCAINGKPEKTTPMQRIFAPKVVWDTIALDFNGPYARFNGISILVIVDYRSRYLMAKPVKSTSFEHTKQVLESIFDKEGFPKIIRTDNGPPFNGEDYKRYCNERGIQMSFSTPLFPQQNGLVEGYMKIVNKAMNSAAFNSTSFVDELRSAVQAHNSSVNRVTGIAPEEIMTGRKIKRGLPLVDHAKVEIDDNLLDKLDRDAKLLGKKREDERRGARNCRVKSGDTVIIERTYRTKGESRFAPRRYVVVEERNGSLVLQGDDGNTLRRHVSQTKKVSLWRDIDTPSSASIQPGGSVAQRTVRAKTAPAYLKDYVQAVDMC
ncbi:uncharacterized protein K02A2.6-like [Armigeres subalbatus]|uniref:uncharacterized protein K02A2.6-like n=1 Tax=Armigeres subalbatus TaxID=124917 RepID=UPI002ED40156